MTEAPASTASAARLAHVRALDGLRGIAVLAVLFYHGGVSWLPGGFLGVDLFFVLSGYLITTLLLREATMSGRLDLVAFWGRRARRLLPALLVLIVLVALLAPLVLSDSQRAGLGGDGFAALFYVANWHFVLDGQDYFAAYADPSPLLHTWSLAIEEQFYLVWPVVVALLWFTRAPRRWIVVAAAVGATASAVWILVLHGGVVDPNRLYLGTDTRAQTIMIGALAALAVDAVVRRGLLPRVPRPATRVVGFLALAGALAFMAVVHDDAGALYVGGLTVFAVLVALVIGSCMLAPGGLVIGPLSWRPLTALGVISYGVYLYHWPVFLVLDGERTGWSGPALLALRLVFTLALSIASYVLIEQPIRRKKWPTLSTAWAAPAAMAGTAAVLALAPVAAPSSTGEPVAGEGLPAVDVGRVVAVPSTPAPSSPTASSTPTPRPTKAAPVRAVPAGPITALVLGDSVAYTLGAGLPDTGGRDGVTIRIGATVGCGITLADPYRYFGSERRRQPKCKHWERTWRKAVDAVEPDVVVVLVGRWEITDQDLDGTWGHIGEPAVDSYLRRQLGKTIPAATPERGRVVFLSSPYYLHGERPDGGRWPEDDPARVDAWNTLLRDVVDRHTDVASVVEFGARTAGGAAGYVRDVDGVQLRYDGTHFTGAAGSWIAPWLYDQLRTATP